MIDLSPEFNAAIQTSDPQSFLNNIRLAMTMYRDNPMANDEVILKKGSLLTRPNKSFYFSPRAMLAPLVGAYGNVIESDVSYLTTTNSDSLTVYSPQTPQAFTAQEPLIAGYVVSLRNLDLQKAPGTVTITANWLFNGLFDSQNNPYPLISHAYEITPDPLTGEIVIVFLPILPLLRQNMQGSIVPATNPEIAALSAAGLAPGNDLQLNQYVDEVNMLLGVHRMTYNTRNFYDIQAVRFDIQSTNDIEKVVRVWTTSSTSGNALINAGMAAGVAGANFNDIIKAVNV